MDGNPAVAPPGFCQLYVIRCPLGNTAVSTLYALLQRKSLETYENLLHAIVDKCSELHQDPDPTTLLNYFDATYCTGTYRRIQRHAPDGEPPRERVKRVYTQLQSRLHQLCVDRRDGNKTVEEFLRGAGHNIRWKPHGNQNQVVE